MGSRTYSGKPFRDLMNSNYYPLANMKKSVAKLKASKDIDLPTLEYGQYHLILTPASNGRRAAPSTGTRRRAGLASTSAPSRTRSPCPETSPGVIPLTRCDLLDACVRKCFNSEPPIPMKTNIITHAPSDAYRGPARDPAGVGVQEGLGQADAAPSDDGLPAQGLIFGRFCSDLSGLLSSPLARLGTREAIYFRAVCSEIAAVSSASVEAAAAAARRRACPVCCRGGVVQRSAATCGQKTAFSASGIHK